MAKLPRTPLMKQYDDIKAVHGDAILLFRVGDFYETFGQDAVKASGILGITLTRRANGAAASVELAGFPYHALDTYLPKLVRAGERVAICEQLEDPRTVKGLVKRGIIELVTPGVAMNDNTLSSKENTFLAAVYFGKKSTGVAFADLSTGEFYVAEGNDGYVDKLISNFAPKEIVYQRGWEERFGSAFGKKLYSYRLDEWVFSEDINRGKLCKQFGTTSLKGFGIDGMTAGISAAGAVLYYLNFTEHKDLQHISSIVRIDESEYVWIDRYTARNLELFSSNSYQGKSSFAEVIDRTVTPMGGRLLKQWIALPLKDMAQLNSRLDITQRLAGDSELRESVAGVLSLIGDMERLSSRIAAGRITPREVVQLRNSIEAISKLRNILEQTSDPILCDMAGRLDLCEEQRGRIESEIYPDPQNNQIQKGGVIADGVDMELDDLRRMAHHGKEVIADIQRRESEATGIPSLKVSFNNVFGYYIEVRNAHRDKVPDSWIRKQTLTSAERYITQELKEYEEKILGAEEKMLAIEQRLYTALLEYLAASIPAFQRNGATVSRLDCLLSFAIMAVQRHYCRPELSDDRVIDIRDGRHPVIETLLDVGQQYIPNDVYLDDSTQQIMIITGPNMAGKSALLRQTALITLMAQMGSFVPASSAHIGIVDRIFTRVGASDNISYGESTFMVEMLESASIMNNLSDRSLVLLDEIGRGTSTYDGMSIAWSMVEYIHEHPARAKTMFATHYHELNELEELLPRVKNYNVSVREMNRTILFLRKLVRGGTEHSFGIHVAKMAGMPSKVVERAEMLLSALGQANSNDQRLRDTCCPATAPAWSQPSGGISQGVGAQDEIVGEIRQNTASDDRQDFANVPGQCAASSDGQGFASVDGQEVPNSDGQGNSNAAGQKSADDRGQSIVNAAGQYAANGDGKEASDTSGQRYADDPGQDSVNVQGQSSVRGALRHAALTKGAKGAKDKASTPSIKEIYESTGIQLSMFQLDDPVLVRIRDQIRDLNIDSLTPIQALNILNDIKKIAGI